MDDASDWQAAKTLADGIAEELQEVRRYEIAQKAERIEGGAGDGRLTGGSGDGPNMNLSLASEGQNRPISQQSPEKRTDISTSVETHGKDPFPTSESGNLPEPEIVSFARRALASGDMHIGQLAARLRALEVEVARTGSVDTTATKNVRLALRLLLEEEVKRQEGQLGIPIEPTMAQGRISHLGLTIVEIDHKGPLKGGQVTREEYEDMLTEAARTHHWTYIDAANHIPAGIRENLGYEEGITREANPHREKFRDSWVRDNATTISILARKHGIDPEVLAFISWQEVGGKPDDLDNWLIPFFSMIDGKKRVFDISGGDVSILLRHVAKQNGQDWRELTVEDARRLLGRLQESQAYNIDVVARHLRNLKKQAWPDRNDENLDASERMWLSYMYVHGFRKEASDPERPLPSRPGRASKPTEARINVELNHMTMLLKQGREILG